MADKLVNITSGSSLLAKTETTSSYGTGTVTFTIILFLLVVISAVMAYNYWVIFTYVPKSIDNEAFSSDMTNSDAVDHGSSSISSVNVPGLRPIVQATIDRAAKYEEGHMSPELKRYYEENRIRDENQAIESVHKQREHEQQHAKAIETVTVDPQKVNKKSVEKEPGITKLIVFHMRGCGHCVDIMEKKQENNKTKFEHLIDIFAQDPSVQIMDFQYGRDREAEKYNGFPVILIVTGDGEEEYMGPREVPHIAKAVINKKQ